MLISIFKVCVMFAECCFCFLLFLSLPWSCCVNLKLGLGKMSQHHCFVLCFLRVSFLNDEISIIPPYCPSLFLQVCLAVFWFLLFSFLVLAALGCVLCWCYSSYSWWGSSFQFCFRKLGRQKNWSYTTITGRKTKSSGFKTIWKILVKMYDFPNHLEIYVRRSQPTKNPKTSALEPFRTKVFTVQHGDCDLLYPNGKKQAFR